MSRILVVDDDAQMLDVVGKILVREGHQVEVAQDGRQAVHRFAAGDIDLVITDIIMPDKEGLETIAELRALDRNLPIIAMSGGGRLGPSSYLDSARSLGASTTLAKPFARSELITAVTHLLSEHAD